MSERRRTLHLLRHAKSSWSDETLDDHARPLAARGRADAASLADAWARAPHPLDQVLCSTAVRARETLEALRPSLGAHVTVREERGLFHASGDALAARLRRLPTRVQDVMLVAHSPGLDELVARWGSDEDADARASLSGKFPTCAVVTLTFDAPTWRAVRDGSARIAVTWRPNRGDARRAGADLAAGPTKAAPIELPRDVRWGAAATTVFDATRRHLEANLPGAAEGAMENVHQARVAARRLRVALALFRDVLDERSRVALARTLRDLGRALGPLREVQVFERDVLTSLRDGHPRAPALAALSRAVEAETNARTHAVRAALRGPAGRRLHARLAGLRVEGDPGETKRARGRARRRLTRLARRVLRDGAELASLDAEAVHELRKRTKKLRYAAEALASLFEHESATRYLAAVRRLQDALGAEQDADVARTLTQALLRRHGGESHVRRASAWVAHAPAVARDRLDEEARAAFDAFAATAPFF